MSTSTSAVPSRRPGDWLGIVFVAVLWAFLLIGWLFDFQSFAFFLVTMAIYLLITIVFSIWWFTRRSFTWGQRFLIFAGALLFGVLVGWLSRRAISMPFHVMFFGLPIVLTLWSAWVLATPRTARGVRSAGLIACLAVGWALLLLIRVNGLKGNLRADLSWRWTPTAEEMYLSQSSSGGAVATTMPAGARLQLRPGDWPGFRGPDRDGAVRNLRIALDWSQSPPKVLWRRRLGPAWSSMAVVDGRVFTQEQRGPQEAVVCRDAASGEEIWVHNDSARFEEPMSGPGPRATPTFTNGRIYAQGALGTLDCLDAASGQLIWSRDVKSDAAAAVPMWAFCGSPLVLDDRVVVFAGGEGKKGLLAYGLDGGPPLWTADAGKSGYASPQLFAAGADRQILMFTDDGLFAVDPANGQLRWQFPIERHAGLPSALQACQVGPDSLVLGNGASFGAQRIHISSDGRSATRTWVTMRMKPAFSDMVYHDGYIYGFDGTVFCCVDANTGDRKWRDGRYGAGQVILLADQGVMIVSSEDGQAILLRCNPQHNEELGRVPAVSGKAWNHPAIAQDRLYLRSDAEIVCLQLTAIGQ